MTSGTAAHHCQIVPYDSASISRARPDDRKRGKGNPDVGYVTGRQVQARRTGT